MKIYKGEREMAKVRVITNEVLQRVDRADQVLSNWMRANGIYEIDPEGCMSKLVESGIYKYDSKNKGHHFREDLRTLRDNNKLDLFTNLVIEQNKPRSRWLIKLK